MSDEVELNVWVGCERIRCPNEFLRAKAHQRFCSEKCRKLEEKRRSRVRKRAAVLTARRARRAIS